MNLSVLISGYGCGCLTAANAATLFGPSLYFEAKDSPFYGGIVDNTGEGIFLEDFEDHALNTPNVRHNNDLFFEGNTYRIVAPNAGPNTIIGVDGDDGAIDGQTGAGNTWTTIDKRTRGISGEMEFIFEPNAEGHLPLYVGFVVTRPRSFDRDVEIGWLDENGMLLESDGEFDPRDWAPPGGANAIDPRLHRFIGLFHEEGIRALQISNVSQLDHLQYGYAIPEPSASGMLLLAVIGRCSLRRRK